MAGTCTALCETLRDPQAALSVSLLRDSHRAQTLPAQGSSPQYYGGHQKPVGFACLRTNETEPVEPFICRANPVGRTPFFAHTRR